MKNKMGSLVLLCALTSCSNMQVSTNAGTYAKDKMQTEISHSVIKEVSRNEIWQLTHQNLGLVSAEHCQVKHLDYTPSMKTMKLTLKKEVLALGGNALVFDACLQNRTSGECVIYQECRGIAYSVEEFK